MRFSIILVLCWINLAHAVEPENLVWDSPSKDCHGSMPLGNGDIALNAWVEPSGALCFYIGKTDSWGDNGRLLKVGKVRVTFDPPLSAEGFRQELDLKTGSILIQSETSHLKSPSGADQQSPIRLWVDANQPTIHISGKRPATAAIELWRTRQETLPSIEVSDVLNLDPARRPTIVEPDTILTDQKDHIGWYHRNIKSVGPKDHADIQGVAGFQREDPLLHRTFGALVTAPHAKRIDDTHLQSPLGDFAIYVLTKHPATSEQWLAEVEKLARKPDLEAHQRWWSEFWNRSWIRATGTDDAEYVSQMYALQRFITACAGRGEFSIKFNGSLFTVPHPGSLGDADYRRWGPGYWWQNTRLPYYSLCASGDFEMQAPLWRMYVDRLLPLNQYRTKQYFGFDDAAYYAECIQFWGDVFLETYGWMPVEQRQDPLQASGWHKWEWVAGPELVWMMLDNYDYTRNQEMLEERILPTANAVMHFYDHYYKTNDRGQLVMHPSQALETWWKCTNPMSEVAGLRAITTRLLALPESATPPAFRTYWKQFLAKLPPLPTRDTPTGKALAPAEAFADKRNIENPELYAVFPFRLCSFEKENRALGINALKHRWDRDNIGWRQGDIFMAYLGLADEARQTIVGRARNHDRRERFPAFWGPNYDWTPDQCHGGVLMKAFQSMLVQTEGDQIFLLPAWPPEWDVNFKLHAPNKTTIAGKVVAGKVTQLQVTPASREQDVRIIAPFTR